MSHSRPLLIITIAVCIVLFCVSCSGHESPVIPETQSSISQDIPDSFGIPADNRHILAVYDALIDPSTGTFSVTAVERSALFHFPLSRLFPNVLTITGYGWAPSFWADMKLTHPLPGSGIDGFDPRVIAILPANPGVSFNYPNLNAIGNNRVVKEPDGYTKLFDELGGSIPGNTNPFKAYFKDEPFRVWSSTGVTSETQRWNLNFSGFGGPAVFKLVVDVSTNYPNPPQPGIDNAPEPVEMDATFGEGLTIDGGDTSIEVSLLDWQDTSGMGDVEVEAPALFSNTRALSFYSLAPQTNRHFFRGTISNEYQAPEGEYSLLVKASDKQRNIPTYNEFTARVEGEIPSTLEDVTPPWFNFWPIDIFIEGNYAYLACAEAGLHIFDISNPIEPSWVNRVDTPDYANNVHVEDGYAYVTDDDTGLLIIDVDPPDSAQIVKVIDMSYNMDVYISNGYAFVAANELQIIDIDPIDSAQIVKTVDMPQMPHGVHVSNGYAYVADWSSGLQIVDIDPIESAYIIGSVDFQNLADKVFVSGDYAYVAGGDEYQIINVSSPENPYVVTSISAWMDVARDIKVFGNYAYLTNASYGFRIFDITSPENPQFVVNIGLPGYGHSSYLQDGYAYVTAEYGVQIVDIDPPSNAFIAGYIDTEDATISVAAQNDFAYSLTPSELRIIDVETPETANTVKKVGPFYRARRLAVSNGYAYVTDYGSGVNIVDIDPVDLSHIVKSISTTGNAEDIHVANGYAYVADNGVGLQIIDVDPPELAYIVDTVSTSGAIDRVHVSDGYAYVNDYNKLQIIDIDPPETSFLFNSVVTSSEIEDIFAYNGYAYIVNFYDGLQIIDVNPPAAAHAVKTIGTFDPKSVFIFQGYAYVGGRNPDLQVIDIDPPELAHIVTSISTPESVTDVFVNNGYVYSVAESSKGLWISSIN